MLKVPVGAIKVGNLGNKGTRWVCSMQELGYYEYRVKPL